MAKIMFSVPHETAEWLLARARITCDESGCRNQATHELIHVHGLKTLVCDEPGHSMRDGKAGFILPEARELTEHEGATVRAIEWCRLMSERVKP